MPDYRFYTDLLRFIAAKAGAEAERLTPMADEFDATGGEITVAPMDFAPAARAFAGVAGFLQQQILPETVAHGHVEVEKRVRWSVDASMDCVRVLLAHAAEGTDRPVTVRLPEA